MRDFLTDNATITSVQLQPNDPWTFVKGREIQIEISNSFGDLDYLYISERQLSVAIRNFDEELVSIALNNYVRDQLDIPLGTPLGWAGSCESGIRNIMKELIIKRGAGGDEKNKNEMDVDPPVRAEQFLDWALPPSKSSEAIGDLNERFREVIRPRDGKKWADLWYWRQAIGAVLPMWRRAIWNRIKGLGIVAGVGGALGWLWEKLSS